MRSEGWIQPELERLEKQDLLRSLTSHPGVGGKFVNERGREILNFSSNDYLGLAQRPEIVTAARQALEKYGCGSTASRLMSGTLPLHAQLEAELAGHKGYPAALVFGSGFLANAGTIPALVGRGDTIYADKLVHASILDSIRLSRARLVRFRHNDATHLRKLFAKNENAKGRSLVVTESVFSMDGDIAPLTELTEICERYEAMLMVDEAHATGVFGPSGTGVAGELELQGKVNVGMGTFSKALGNYGGFVACSKALQTWLTNRARTFIFTTAPPPSVTAGCLAALRILEREPMLGRELRRRADAFRALLREHGLDTGQSRSQIIPIMVGPSDVALRLAIRLAREGILAVAVRPPTVPTGTARLRLSVTLAHETDDLEYAAHTICQAAQAEGVAT